MYAVATKHRSLCPERPESPESKCPCQVKMESLVHLPHTSTGVNSTMPDSKQWSVASFRPAFSDLPRQ